MAKKSTNTEEQEWRAEADADLMARYAELMTDAPRVDRAIKAAQKKAAALQEGADRMKRVANSSKKKKD